MPTLASPVPECIFCHRRKETKVHPHVCRSCRPTLPFDCLVIAADYEGIAKNLVHKLKFERARSAAYPMAEILAQYVSSVPVASGIVTHLPTASRRIRQRGYDQSALVAKFLARNLGLPYAALLHRQGDKRQLGQGRRIRQVQLEGAFWTAAHLQNKHVILVDDVITTGASTVRAATVLREAGADSITVAIFARAARRS